MRELEMPRNLLRAVEDADAHAAQRAWMAALPIIVDDLARRWSLAVGGPFQPGGVASWVARARDAAGDRVVLKVGWRHDEALHEADGLRAWGGTGAVRLLDAVTFGETSALLLEACDPGSPLSEVQPAPRQDAVLAGLLRRLWIAPPAGHGFRTLQSMCDAWADELERRGSAAGARSPTFDRGLERAGIELFRGLPGSAERCVLLCTDLHPGNVLAAEREPWLAIDPKPYVGDPTYDALQHMLNFPDRLAGDAAGLIGRMAELLELDRERLRLWLFARCVHESVDEPQLRSVAMALAP